MLRKFFFSLALILPFAAQADWDNYGGAGLNINTYKEDLPNQYDLEDDLTLGATAGWKTIGRWGNLGFRTGAMFEYQRVSIDDTGSNPNIDLKSFYVAVPLNLQFEVVDDAIAIFGGITPRVLLAKTCEDCGTFDNDGNFLTNYANGGITWKFADRWSADFIFNHALGDNFEDLKINTAQAILFYEFE